MHDDSAPEPDHPEDHHPEGHTDLHPHDRADRPRPGPAGPPGGSVVVGVDGSEASRAALDWALRYADAGRARVLAVTVWHEPVQTSAIGAVGSSTRREQAEATLDRTVNAVASDDAPVDRAVERGRTEEVLLRRSRQADLLVLGNHRRGRLASIGSVVQECLRAADCPVAVIPVVG
ncbi:universal stress protein [Pseudonocardia nantongensis]|uniref:universal stress protein n=1 Tax=Pseudonocardia nantongensis TaxID=1181885 RepID=UPI00397CAA7C